MTNRKLYSERKDRLLHRETKKIKGLNNEYEFEYRLNFKTGVFNVNYPVEVFKDNLIKTDFLYDRSLEELRKKLYYNIMIFEQKDDVFEDVILYKFNKEGDYRDGSGIGFLFNWAVCKKNLDVKYGSRKYRYVRGFSKQTNDGEYAVNYNENDWKEIKHTKDIEDFFELTSMQIYNIYDKLEKFFAQQNLEEFISNLVGKNLKLDYNG